MSFDQRRHDLRRHGWPREIVDRLRARPLLKVHEAVCLRQPKAWTIDPGSLAETIGDGDARSVATWRALSNGPSEYHRRVTFAMVLGLTVGELEDDLGWKPLGVAESDAFGTLG